MNLPFNENSVGIGMGVSSTETIVKPEDNTTVVRPGGIEHI